MVLGSTGIENDAKSGTAGATTERLHQLPSELGQLFLAVRGDQRNEPAALKVESVGQFLQLHLLVSNGMKALGDAKFAGKSRNGMFINTDELGHATFDTRRCRLHELLDALGGSFPYQCTQTTSIDDLAAAGEYRKAGVVQRLEVEDPLNAQYCFEVQRKDQPTTPSRSQGAEQAFSDAVQADCAGQQQKGAAIDSAA